MDGDHASDIDRTTTLRANILRDFFNRSQTKSPVKPGLASPPALPPALSPALPPALSPALPPALSPALPPTPSPAPRSSEGYHPFLDMIRSQRGFPMPTQPPKDAEDQGDKTEDDVSTTKTQESSMADAEVSPNPIPVF